ncbi:hypothetical protein IT407_00150 [Candidatus Uhrbacteria bacterium]|nr:hypothetical protein [Candidatus Uhrbacteria bacterium]
MALEPVTRLKEWWSQLPGERRFSASIIGICGILIVVLSTAYMRSHLSTPFLVPKSVLDQARPIYEKQAREANEAQASRERDTDRDGLSDWSELNTYRTSPYLADTDSDDIIDAIEIAQGSDPNCPQGQRCDQLANQQQSGTASSSFSALLEVEQVQAPGTLTGAAAFIQNAPDPATVSPSRMRALLIENGLSDSATISPLTDAEVTALYRATYAEVLKIRQAATKQGVPINNPTTTAPTAP